MLFAFDAFVFDDALYELRDAGKPVKAEAQVLELLSFMLRNPGRVVSKEELIHHVWHGAALGDNVISVCVAKLRRVLGGRGNRYISSAYGRGYRFLRPVKTDAEQPSPQALQAPSDREALLVGRTSVVTRLETALSRAAAGRTVSCALLGEAGIGKTRMAEVLEQSARTAGFLVSWGRCHGFHDVPALWPWLQIVRSCESVLPLELRVRAAVQAELQTRDAPLTSTWGSTSVEDWARTLSWIGQVVAHVCSAQPWLIILDDVQWADAASLQLLAHIVAETAHLPLLIVMTVRDSSLPSDKRARRVFDYVLGHPGNERIELSRLPPSDVASYASQLFGKACDELVAAIYAKSEGNPFFMVELLRPFVHGPAPLPSELLVSVRSLEILRQTLHRFSPETLAVLSAAAVIGRSFDLGLLATVMDSDSERALELLEDTMDAHVVVAARDSHTDYAFGHDLMRNVLYDDLPQRTRIRLHERVAKALSLRVPGTTQLSNVGSAELAHHLLSALPLGSVSHAVDSARRAALTAIRVGAQLDACKILRRAHAALRSCAEIDPRIHCELLFDLAACERACGEPSFADHFDAAVALAREHRFSDVLAAAGQVLSSGPGIMSTAGAADILHAALAALPEEDASRRALVLAHLSWTTPNCADRARVATLLEAAQRYADSAGYAAKRTVLRAKLYFAGGPADTDRALSIAGDMERLLSANGPAQLARWSLEPQLARIVALLQRGELAQAELAVETFGAAARELQHAELIWHYERMLVILRMNVGEFSHAKTRLLELKERAERLNLHARRAVEALDWSELIRQTTNLGPVAAQLAGQIRPDAADSPNVRAYKLRVLTRLGFLDEARSTLQAITVAELQALPHSRDYLATLGHLAFTSVETGSLLHARALYDLLSPYPQFFVASLSCHCHGAVSHFLGILARTLGDRERALAHFEVALVEQEKRGLHPQLAHTRHELARMLADSTVDKDRDRALRLTRAAHETACELGMEPLRTATEQLLAQSRAHASS